MNNLWRKEYVFFTHKFARMGMRNVDNDSGVRKEFAQATDLEVIKITADFNMDDVVFENIEVTPLDPVTLLPLEVEAINITINAKEGIFTKGKDTTPHDVSELPVTYQTMLLEILKRVGLPDSLRKDKADLGIFTNRFKRDLKSALEGIIQYNINNLIHRGLDVPPNHISATLLMTDLQNIPR